MFRQLDEFLSSSIFIFAFFLASNSTLAHYNYKAIDCKNNLYQNDDFSERYSKDLRNRLGLTADQTSQFANILTDYRNNVLNNNQDNPSMNNSADPQQVANDKIISLLDESQKAAFAQMGKNWWTNINQDIGSTNGRH